MPCAKSPFDFEAQAMRPRVRLRKGKTTGSNHIPRIRNASLEDKNITRPQPGGGAVGLNKKVFLKKKKKKKPKFFLVLV